MMGAAGSRRRVGITLIEICVAIGILAFCFLPIIQFSKQNVRETQVSQEDLIARHFLMEMVEQLKGANLTSLRQIPSSEIPLPLGQVPPFFKGDDLLGDQKKVLEDIKAKQAAGTGTVTDKGAIVGGEKLQSLQDLMVMTRNAVFREGQPPNPRIHELTCIVRWQSAISKNERRLEYTKILVK